jgi:acetyl-CoA synthetase (ADP-forming)
MGGTSFSLLKKYGISTILYKLANDEDEAVKYAKNIGFPVAIKAICKEIVHKSDVGAVKLGLRTEEEVMAGARDLLTRFNKFKPKLLVQKMARKGVEVFIGGKKDPLFGHLILLGLGGVYVEIFKDVSARLCPIKKEDVLEMVEELKSKSILLGARGRKAINKDKLCDLMIKVCRMMVKEDIKELDLNPVIFDDKGYDIVDVRVVK